MALKKHTGQIDPGRESKKPKRFCIQRLIMIVLFWLIDTDVLYFCSILAFFPFSTSL